MLKSTGKLMPEAKPRTLSLWFTAFFISSLGHFITIFFLIPFAESYIFVKTSGKISLHSEFDYITPKLYFCRLEKHRKTMIIQMKIFELSIWKNRSDINNYRTDWLRQISMFLWKELQILYENYMDMIWQMTKFEFTYIQFGKLNRTKKEKSTDEVTK